MVDQGVKTTVLGRVSKCSAFNFKPMDVKPHLLTKSMKKPQETKLETEVK